MTSVQAVHKIQSKGGSTSLQLNLRPVPKMLGLVSAEWCPQALNVSFKVRGGRCWPANFDGRGISL